MVDKNIKKHRDESAIELWNKFDAFMEERGYHIFVYNEVGLGRGTSASLDDKFAPVIKLCVWGGETPSNFLSIHVMDRNGSFVLSGDTAAIYSMVDTGDKEKNAVLFDLMLNDVYERYGAYSKSNRLDFVFNKIEQDRKIYDENVLEERKVLSVVGDIARKCVAEYPWKLPSYSNEGYDSYSDYESACLDVAHEARPEIFGAVCEGLKEAGVIESGDVSYYEVAEEIIWQEMTDWVATHEDAEPVKEDAAVEVYFDNVHIDTVYCAMDKAGAVIGFLVQNGYDNYNGAVKEDWEREGGRVNPDISFRVVKAVPEKVSSVDRLISDAADKSLSADGIGKASPGKDISLG